MTDDHAANEYQRKLSFAAHELCTPLTLIKFYAEMIKESDPAETQKMADSIINISGELTDSTRLLLLAVDAKEKGCGPSEAIDLQAFMTQRVQLFSALAESKNITLSHDIKSPVTQMAHVSALTIILNNFISNALKFTPEGGQVTISLNDSNPRTLRVIDTAETIAEDQRDSIFEAFIKADKDKSHSGFGLGLCICKHITDKWQQRIWVEPNPGGGNQFCFTLPTDA